MYNFPIFTAPRGRERSIAISLSVCVCLFVREHISAIAGRIFTKSIVQIPGGRGSVLLWRHCDMLCTSGFMDDVTFGRRGWYSDASRLFCALLWLLCHFGAVCINVLTYLLT